MFLDFWKTNTMPQYILMCVFRKKKKRKKSLQNWGRFRVARNTMYWLNSWITSSSSFCQKFGFLQAHVIFHSCTLLKHVTPLNTLFRGKDAELLNKTMSSHVEVSMEVLPSRKIQGLETRLYLRNNSDDGNLQIPEKFCWLEMASCNSPTFFFFLYRSMGGYN